MKTKRRKSNPEKSFLRTIRRRIRTRKWILPAAAVVLAAVLIGVILIVIDRRNQDTMEFTASEDAYVGSGYRDVIWQGDHYRYNNRITAILMAGLDSEGDVKELAAYTMAPRSDSIQLVLLDQKTHKLKVVAINRDTMTLIRKYTLDGYNRGLLKDHLAWAFTYGNGGKVSCQNLCEAVSLLLYDIPIRDYVVVNRSSLGTLAEIIGPVEVTVPNDDLAEEDAAFTKGAKAVIDSGNLEWYVRSRDIEKALSNTGRMERQRSYISAAMDQILNKVSEDPTGVWKDMQKAEDCMLTSLTRSRYMDLVRIMQDVSYSDEDYLQLPGEQVSGEYHDEFYPDEEALLQMVIDLFYIKQ